MCSDTLPDNAFVLVRDHIGIAQSVGGSQDYRGHSSDADSRWPAN
jgi:hypothetical protein